MNIFFPNQNIIKKTYKGKLFLQFYLWIKNFLMEDSRLLHSKYSTKVVVTVVW